MDIFLVVVIGLMLASFGIILFLDSITDILSYFKKRQNK